MSVNIALVTFLYKYNVNILSSCVQVLLSICVPL